MKTTKVKMIIAFVMSFALIISTLAVTPPQEAKATYMPLERVENLSLDLSDLFPDEMSAVPVSTMLSRLKDAQGNPVTIDGSVIAYRFTNYFSNEYKVLGVDNTMNFIVSGEQFSPRYTQYGSLELIIGNSVDQLNLSNKRYVINLNQVNWPNDLIVPHVYLDRNGTNIAQQCSRGYINDYNGVRAMYLMNELDDTVWDGNTPVFIKIGTGYGGVSLKVYKGLANSVDQLNGLEEITDKAVDAEGIYFDPSKYPNEDREITIVLKKNDKIVIAPVEIYVVKAHNSINIPFDVYTDVSHGYGNQAGYRVSSRYIYSEPGIQNLVYVTYELYNGKVATDVYYPMTIYNTVRGNIAYNDVIQKAVVGKYKTIEDAIDAIDIKDQLFGDGYKTNYSNETFFTVFKKDGTIDQYSVVMSEREAESGTDLYIYEPSGYYRGIRVSSFMDSYYDNGFLADLFMEYNYSNGHYDYFAVATGGAVSIKPSFSASSNSKVYASQNGQSATLQESGVSEIAYYENEPVLYTVAAEDGEKVKNYLVSFVSQQAGPKLYVHGLTDETSYVQEGNAKIPTREVIMTDSGSYHDVFFANVGDEDIEGLYVRLENAQNVKIDDYWNIGATTTLSAFTEVPYNNNDEYKNIGKVRLVPTQKDVTGAVSGTLVIGYTGNGTNGEEIRIKLTGLAGKAKIMTQSINNAVKYIPYSTVIQNSAMNSGNSSVTYTLSSGKLPDGFTLKPNGELYGIPTETTMEYDEDEEKYVDIPYSFEVTMEYTYRSRYNDRVITSTDKKNYELFIRDNTKENIEEINNNPEIGYKVLDYVPEEVDIATASGAGIEFRTEGAFSDYRDLYIDGQKMTRDTDYSAEEGSTKITIYNKTFANIGVGEHTISAVFRDNNADDGTLKTSNQLFKVTRKTTPSPSYSGGDSSSSTSDISDAEENNEKKETKNGDGSVTTTTEKKNKDGSTTTISETKNKNGSVETKSVTKALDGSETIETKVTNKDGSTSSEKVVKDKDGNILSTKTTSDHTKKDGTRITESQTVKADGTGDYKKKETMPSGRTETTTAKMKEDGSIDASVSIKTVAGVKITKNYEVNEDGSLTLTKVKTKNKTAVIPAAVTLFGKKYKVTSVSPNAFKGNKSITKVKIGKNITSIDLNAFKNASNLNTVIIKSTDIEEVAANAFKGIASKAIFKFEMTKKDFEKMKEIFEAIVPKDAVLKRTDKK